MALLLLLAALAVAWHRSPRRRSLPFDQEHRGFARVPNQELELAALIE